MRIERRQFLKYCVGSAAALSLPMTVLGKLEQALADDAVTLPKVIWLNAANCTGCTVSLANLFSDSGPADVADLLLNTIDLQFHPNLMGATGDLAVQQLKTTALGDFILVVEGGVPTAFDGHTCLLWTETGSDVTAMEAVQVLAPQATAVLCVGTCSSFGGIPAGDPNPTGIVSVSKLTGISTINIPGCPTHPDWIVSTIAHLIAGETPQTDSDLRPVELFGSQIHQNCPNKGGDKADAFGQSGKCMKDLGCNGPVTRADCPSRKWNNGTNWCIGAGAICIGCTENGFPDSFSPFYNVSYEYKLYDSTQDSTGTTGPGILTVTGAQWNQQTSTLTVNGDGEPGQIVVLSNADTGDQIGAVSVNSSGGWNFRQKNTSPIPTQLSVTSFGDTVLYSVTVI